MWTSYFSVSKNGENGLDDEGADGAMAPRIFGLEPPERISSWNHFLTVYWTLTNPLLVDLAVVFTTLTTLKILIDWLIDWLIRAAHVCSYECVQF